MQPDALLIQNSRAPEMLASKRATADEAVAVLLVVGAVVLHLSVRGSHCPCWSRRQVRSCAEMADGVVRRGGTTEQEDV